VGKKIKEQRKLKEIFFFQKPKKVTEKERILPYIYTYVHDRYVCTNCTVQVSNLKARINCGTFPLSVEIMENDRKDRWRDKRRK